MEMPKRHPKNGTGKAVKVQEAKPEYTAAVRYHDGSSELIRIKDADNLADARAMIKEHILNVRTTVIALRKTDY